MTLTLGSRRREASRFARIATFFSRLTLAFTALWLAACEPIPVGGTSTGPKIDTGAAVPVALLVPKSGGSGGGVLADNLEKSARLAMSDLNGVNIDLRVYDSGGNGPAASAAASQAINDGAKIILGPLFAEEANAVGLVAAKAGINVLAFSNNPSIAGGNVFVLGQLFDDTASRLASYAARQGKKSILVVHGNAGAELIARDAVVRGLSRAGVGVAGTVAFELSQQGVTSAAPKIAAQVQSTGADGIFLTSGTDGALPLLAQLLPENGLGPNVTQWIGLQRWDIPPNARSLPGLQGGWFALPDPTMTTRFNERFAAAYGTQPHPIAGLAYDGIAAIGALVKQGKSSALTSRALTQGQGFVGVGGVFRFLPDGTNQRGLAVAQIRDQQVVVIDPAPRNFRGAGF